MTWILTAYGALAAIFALRAAWAVRATSQAKQRTRGDRPRCTLIRPCAGDRPWTAAAVVSGIDACREGDEVVLAVEDRRDGAWRTLRKIAAMVRRPGVRVTLALGGRDEPNRKACRLDRAMELAHHDVIVVADDDVSLDAPTLDALVDAVVKSGGAAWCPPVEDTRGARTTVGDIGSAAILGSSAHSFLVLGALPSPGIPTFVGKLFAISRRALDEVGGFSMLTNVLGEDHALAKALIEKRRVVQMLAQPAPSIAFGRTLGETVDRYARWLMVIKAQRPHLLPTYPFLIAPLPIALAGLSFLPLLPSIARETAIFSVTWLFATRFALSWLLAKRIERRGGPWWWLVEGFFADVVLLWALGRALTTRSVTWRGRTLTVAHGQLVTGSAQARA